MTLKRLFTVFAFGILLLAGSPADNPQAATDCCTDVPAAELLAADGDIVWPGG